MHHGGSRVNSSRRGVKLDGHQQRGEAGVQNLELGVHHHHQLQGNFMNSLRSLVAGVNTGEMIMITSETTTDIVNGITLSILLGKLRGMIPRECGEIFAIKLC